VGKRERREDKSAKPPFSERISHPSGIGGALRPQAIRTPVVQQTYPFATVTLQQSRKVQVKYAEQFWFRLRMFSKH